MDNYAIVLLLDKHPEDKGVPLFSYLIRSGAVKFYHSFDLSEENWRKLSEIMKEFDKYTMGKTNKTSECYMFKSHDHKKGESIDACIRAISAHANMTC